MRLKSFSTLVHTAAALSLAVIAALTSPEAHAQGKTELLVYSALEADQIKAYKTAFEQDHPAIELKFVRESTGIVTAIPLICFGAAATRVPLTTLGLLQYLAPVLQFALGVFVLDEAMPASRWIGFTLVWVALVIFTVEANTHRRRQLRLTVHASAAA